MNHLRRRDVFVALLFSIYIPASVFYVFPSGTPQPADYLLATTIFFGFLSGVVRASFLRSVTAPLICVVVYFSIVNVANYSQIQDTQFLMSILYVAYNALAFSIATTVGRLSDERITMWLKLSMLVALSIQCIAIFALGEGAGLRATGTFNDPNQLGYMLVLALFSYLVLRHARAIGLLDMAIVILAIALVLEAKSRSATIGIVSMLSVAFFYLKYSVPLKTTFAVLSAVTIAILMLTDVSFLRETQVSQNLETLVERFGETGDDDSLAGRGYYRMIEYPEYLILGAGEGAEERFGTRYEIHSTWAKLLFSYGIPGFGLFIWFLFQTFRRAPWHKILLFVGPATFGLTTYGARFTMFWISLGLLHGISQQAKRSARGR